LPAPAARRGSKAIRRFDRRRLLFPFFLSIVLFAVYFAFKFQPLVLRPHGEDYRYSIFGPHLEELKWLHFAAWLPLILFIVRLIDTLTFDLALSRRRNVAAPELLRQIVGLILYFVIFAAVSTNILERSFTTWLTTGTIVAAVIGLALQETLGNLFSGIALHMEGGFEVGDVVHSGDYTGKVEQVSWRATRIRGFDSQLIVLPNSVLARDRLEVFPLNNLNGRVLKIGVDYNVAPATVIGILMQAASHIDGVARDVPVVARIGAFADSSVVYDLKYYTRDYFRRESIDAEVRKAVWYALRRNDISFATPVRAYQQYMPPQTVTHELSRAEVLDLLRGVRLLSVLPAAAIEEITSAAMVHFYSKGEAILRHGAAGDSMFAVHSGNVSIRIADDSPQAWHEVAQLGPSSVFGEMALLTGEARTADVVAVTDVIAVEIGKSSLQPVLQSHPELAGALTANVMARRDHLESVRENLADADEEESVLSRIRTYFGL